MNKLPDYLRVTPRGGRTYTVRLDPWGKVSDKFDSIELVRDCDGVKYWFLRGCVFVIAQAPFGHYGSVAVRSLPRNGPTKMEVLAAARDFTQRYKSMEEQLKNETPGKRADLTPEQRERRREKRKRQRARRREKRAAVNAK